MIRRSIRRNGLNTEQGRKEISYWTEKLLKLIDSVDTLLFSVNELEIEAQVENLNEVQQFVEEKLGNIDCPPKPMMQIMLAVEEIFVNIAHYAYAPSRGNATVRVEVTEEPVEVSITFIDNGVPYDPLKKEDPDISIPASERAIGGLGVFLTKQLMDDVIYEYRDGHNILTLKKNI